ncbi:hypothetical protein OUZ56_024927 [Daphnia magna]|uniref:Transmembrane protein n=1 Tax=Daphnia magna TaxID=35525 RepID=A0ABQ9ZIE7_9CRUS|nr:hypothetical protein OUZ56_024927 [Daphnia magna]
MDRWCLSLSGQISIVQEAKKKENKSDDGGLSHCLFISIASIHLLFFPFLSFFLVFRFQLFLAFHCHVTNLFVFFSFSSSANDETDSHTHAHTHTEEERTQTKRWMSVLLLLLLF